MSGNKPVRKWDAWKMFDVSQDEMRAIRERAKMKQALKAEWTKQSTNPWRSTHGGFLMDPAVQRFIALKATQAEYFRGTFRSVALATCLFVVPVALITRAVIKGKEEREKLFRSGAVMYKDRDFKFNY